MEYIGKISRRCINDKDSFCYTCGEFVFKMSRKIIDEFYMKAYCTYFKIKLGDQDKTSFCYTCGEVVFKVNKKTID